MSAPQAGGGSARADPTITNAVGAGDPTLLSFWDSGLGILGFRDSGFWDSGSGSGILDSGFWILDLVLDLGFWIPDSGFWISI